MYKYAIDFKNKTLDRNDRSYLLDILTTDKKWVVGPKQDKYELTLIQAVKLMELLGYFGKHKYEI